jgi:hypothetical protein
MPFRCRCLAHSRYAILLFTLAGLAWRLAFLIESHWRYDYDEGMVGLQVLRILRGEFPVFHPGQPYLGALESYLIAPLFVLFGPNAITLKLIPWLLSGAYIATTGWLASRAFGPRVASLSALLAAFAPSYLLVVGTKTWGATAETLVLGNLALIATSYVLDTRIPTETRERALTLLGFVGGVACWVSWLFAFYAVPIALVLGWNARPLLRRVWRNAGTAFLIGSAPFWLYNLNHDFATFRYLLRDQGDVQIGEVLNHLNYDLSPRMVSGDPRWKLLSWPATWWLQIVYEGGLVGLAIWSWRGPWASDNRPVRVMLALFAALLPAIYALSGYGDHALNEHGFDATGRYVLMIHSVLPIGAAALCIGLAHSRRWRQIPAAAASTSVIVLNILGALRIEPVQVFTSPYYTRQPPTLAPLIAYLEEEDIHHVWTDVGIAHVLMFETDERILAADWYDIYGAKGLLRFPEVPEKIAAAERVAYVEVVLPDQTDTPLEQAFRDTGIAYRVERVTPQLLVIVPLAQIDPAVLGDGLGYQF